MMRTSWARVGMVLGIAIGTFLQPGMAQTGGGGGNTGGARNSVPTLPPQPPPPQRTQDRRPLMLFGKVEMDDGTAVPGPVSIERVCGGSVHKEAHTNAKGEFSFELGASLGVMQDASNDSSMDWGMRTNSSGNTMAPGMSNIDPVMGLDRRTLMGCELRASSGGFLSTVVDLGRFQAETVVDVGTIFLQRAERVQGTAISATSFQAPKEAKKAYEKGVGAAKKGNLAEAQKELEKAVQIYPRHALAWYELGRILQEQKQVEAAVRAYKQAVDADARFVSPYFPLAQIAAQQGKWQEVVELTKRALGLDPLNYPIGYFYSAAAYYNLHDLDAAEKAARRGERLDQQHRIPRMYLLLATILGEKKNYAEAAGEVKTYLKLAPNAADAAAVKEQLAILERLSRPSGGSAAPQ